MSTKIPILSRINFRLNYHSLVIHCLEVHVEILEHLAPLFFRHLHFSHFLGEFLRIIGLKTQLLNFSLFFEMLSLVGLSLASEEIIKMIDGEVLGITVFRGVEGSWGFVFAYKSNQSVALYLIQIVFHLGVSMLT